MSGFDTGAFDQDAFGPDAFDFGVSAPFLQGSIPNVFQRQNTGNHTYDLSSYFIDVDSYAIAPAVEAGWSFNTGTGVLIIDTDALGVFGPYTVTATNVNGSTPSNAFSVEVAVKNTGAGSPRKRRRFLVEIDGQDFEVSSPEEAQELLARAKAIAQEAVEKSSTPKATRVAPGRVGLARPVIRSADPELKSFVTQARRELNQIYDQAARDYEIASLMAKRIEEEEEETLLRFLM